MKKTIILSTIILLSVMIIGCSDNMGITGPDKQTNSSGIINPEKQTNNMGLKQKPGTGNYELIWEVAELSIDVNDGYPLEKLVSFTVDPIHNSNKYLITFTGFTNADKWINGYVPTVEISNDQEVVLSLIDKASINNYTKLLFEKATENDVEFYIALSPGDNPIGNSKDYSCVLKLSNLQVYIIH
jgi:hypothetical protein